MHPTGPAQHDSASFDRDKSESVRVTLDMGGGEMRVGSGTDKLASADFTYNVAAWKPEARYSAAAGKGELTIKQPDSGRVSMGGNQINHWDVQLNRNVPMEILAHLTAGDAKLNLGDLDLRGVSMQMGAGDLDLDLRGAPKTSYDVRLHGGVGNATVHVPSGVGVEANATGGLGDIAAEGLHQDGHRYYNDALATAKVKVHLDVTGGVGSIRLTSGD